jgi:hypothetical protein
MPFRCHHSFASFLATSFRAGALFSVLVHCSQPMKQTILFLYAAVALISSVYAGSERSSGEEKGTTQVTPARPEWYADNEWNVSLWGAYAFTNDESSDFNVDDVRRTGQFGSGYLRSEDAWGGGIDAKYFFKRYFGVGLEGYVVDVRGSPGLEPIHELIILPIEARAIGSVLGTLTLRYPLPRSRFAPYIYMGGGAIFGGGQRDINVGVSFALVIDRTSGATEAVGQVGAGCEVRLTRHIGWLNDFNWNLINGRDNNFGMVRSGLTSAF